MDNEIRRYERYLLHSDLANLKAKKMRNGTSALGVLYRIITHGVDCALLILGEGNARA